MLVLFSKSNATFEIQSFLFVILVENRVTVKYSTNIMFQFDFNYKICISKP